MNIRKCYIENFGKFHEFEYDFSKGLNIINEKNGWGKSTLATFIKAMFYGFENSNKRLISENERKKYYPWQGGKYGGSLEFEINGKIYEIERFFGQKDKDDTFKLYDKSINMETREYSENIGEEIFKIDRQGYERSTYIPQQSLNVEMNDSLNAKLSNILEGENDINSSENAINRILIEMKEFKKNGNKGKLNEIENKILNKKRELEKANKNEELINERNKKINEIEIKIKELEKEKENNQKLLNDLSENEINILIKNRYDEICNTIQQDEEEIKKLNEYFKNEIPQDEEIQEYEKMIAELEISQSKLNDLINTEDEKDFEELKKYFYEKNINEEIINNNFALSTEIGKLNNELNLLNEKLSSEEKIEKIEEKNKKQKNIIKIIFSIIIILTGIILGKNINNYFYGIIFLGILLSISIFLKNKKIAEKNTKKIIEKINEKNDEINLLKNNLELFLNNFEDISGDNYEKINLIKNKFYYLKNTEKIIAEKENKKNILKENIKSIENNINFKLKSYLNETNSENNFYNYIIIIKKIIYDLKNKKRDLNNLLLKYENDKKIKEKYEEENNIEKIKIINTENEKNNIENIKNKNEIISKELNNLINQKSYDENELNRLINTLETVEEIETEIENLENEKKEVEKKYSILDKTLKYLKKSKENFSSHYLGEMTNGFKKYLKIIIGDTLDTNIDINLDVKIKSNGENKELDYFSAGYKDLIQICIRFALIDALFENEKPFIILDDSFVNLDEEKLEKAKEIIAEFSKRYQVIYFICHESRK